MRTWKRSVALLALLFAAAVGVASPSDVVVLRGGVVIELKHRWARQGNTALLTRADGTLLSVPVSEIDLEATAAAKAKSSAPASSVPAAAPAATAAQAARTARNAPKARVRITDADVGHEMALAPTGASEKSEKEASGGGARVEISDYTQQQTGSNLFVNGSLRNSGGSTAVSVRLKVYALDEKAQPVASGDASLSGGQIEPGRTVDFTASLVVGDKPFVSLRFVPQWIAATAPGSRGSGGGGEASGMGGTPSADASAVPSRAAAKPPAPEPTPYGRGSLYAPPAPSAPLGASPDGKAGYIPAPSHPENQPKPPQ